MKFMVSLKTLNWSNISEEIQETILKSTKTSSFNLSMENPTYFLKFPIKIFPLLPFPVLLHLLLFDFHFLIIYFWDKNFFKTKLRLLKLLETLTKDHFRVQSCSKTSETNKFKKRLENARQTVKRRDIFCEQAFTDKEKEEKIWNLWSWYVTSFFVG